VARPALVLVGTAAIAAALDLAHKANAAPAHLHHRSAGYVVLVLGLTLAWAAAIVLTRSPAMALGGGVAAGGAIGNVSSLVFWAGVPNPIEAAPIAFNLADVFVLLGFLLVAGTTIRLAVGDRERLGEPLRLR
jgi:lipoprotein signal peptidase